MSDIPEHMLFGYPTKREYDAGELDNAHSNEFQVYTSFILGKVAIIKKKNYLDGFMPIAPRIRCDANCDGCCLSGELGSREGRREE